MVVRQRNNEIPSLRYHLHFYRLPKGPLPQDYLSNHINSDYLWKMPYFRRGQVFVSHEREKAFLFYRDEQATDVFLRTADLVQQ